MGFNRESEKGEITAAGAEMLRAVAMIVPIIGIFFAAGLFVSQVLSAPFDISCRSNARSSYVQSIQDNPLEQSVQKFK